MGPINNVDPDVAEIEIMGRTPNLLSKIFDKRKRKEEFVASPAALIISGLIFVAIVMLIVYRGNFKNFVKDSIGKFILYTEGVDMEFPHTKPIQFDTDSFFNGANVNFRNEASGNKERYRQNFYENYEKLLQYSGMTLPGVEQVDYEHIYINIYSSDKSGNISMYANWNSYRYFLTGLFAIEGYTPKNTEIRFDGQGEKASFAYSYGDNKQAYFVNDWGYGTNTVYFEENGILFRFIITDTEDSIENAKKFIKVIAGQME